MERFKVAKKWLEKAKHDLRATEILISADNFVPYDVICFHCQQGAEKLLKTYLVYNGIDFPFTHNLITLSKLVEKNTNCSDFQKYYIFFDILEPYSVASRYPNDFGMPSRDNAIEAKEALKEIFEWSRCELAELFE